MSEILLTPPQITDLPNIQLLYQSVASIAGGLARTKDEITEEYVRHNLLHSQAHGLCFIARIDQHIVGEIHTYRPTPNAFRHVLSELTIAIHPDYQGRGVGKALFTHLLNEIKANHPDILRVELIARENNRRAIQLYQSIGFVIEGRMVSRIKSIGGGFEADIPMAWHRNKV